MSRFVIEYDMKKRGLPTLFKHQYFTIDAKERKSWDYTNLNIYMGDYELKVSHIVMDKFSENQSVFDTLKDLDESKAKFTISQNNGQRYSGEKQYIKCRITKYVLKTFKKIFISTLVYESENIEIPETKKLFLNLTQTIRLLKSLI